MRVLLAVVCLIACAGCPSLSSLDGFQLPPAAREKRVTFRVLHQPNDSRKLDQAIAGALRRRGLQVVTGESARPDYLVSYVDRWYWDMRMYLIDLRIDVRDAKTHQLVATGRSYQTSLSAAGETHESVIERAVGVVLSGPSEPAASAAAR